MNLLELNLFSVKNSRPEDTLLMVPPGGIEDFGLGRVGRPSLATDQRHAGRTSTTTRKTGALDRTLKGSVYLSQSSQGGQTRLAKVLIKGPTRVRGANQNP